MTSSTRWEFRRFFAAKYAELLRYALSPARRPRYADPALIEDIARGYQGLAATGRREHAIPRHIFMLWQQGWDDAPRIVRACAESWRLHNPGWEVHLLDDTSVRAYVPTLGAFGNPELGRPGRANLARLSMLMAHGGIWADATLFCTRSLDDWLPAATASGLFMFSRPRPYRDVDIWFMATTAGNPAIAAWHAMIERYFALFRRPHHYYWMEYLFEHLVATDSAARDAWLGMPRLSALGPLATAGVAFDRRAPREIYDLLEVNRVPVHKLSHKWPPRQRIGQTPVGVLTGLDRI